MDKLAYAKMVKRIVTPLQAPYECYTGKVLNERQCKIINDCAVAIEHDLENGNIDNVEAGLNNRHRVFVELARV